MNIQRHWAMPNKNTFLIKPIKAIVEKIAGDGLGWADPFANQNSPAEITNDINTKMPTTHHMDALDFLETFDDARLDGIILDPPYSMRQVLESYNGFQVKQITNVYDEAARTLKVGGTAITFGWNSNGLGMKRGMKLEEVHLVAHGGSHNDTILTVETKTAHQMKLFKNCQR